MAGAKLVIVADNVFENETDVIMSNDGYGYLVEIPSIFIN